MRRDFTESARQRLLALVRQVESEKWSNFTDWLGDRWYDFQEWIGVLNIKNYLDNVNAYHKKIIDKNNYVAEKIEDIFMNVNAMSSKYDGKFSAAHTDLLSYQKMIIKLANTVSPAKGTAPFTAQYINGTLAASIDDYLEKSDNLQKQVTEDLVNSSPAFDDIANYGGDQGLAKLVYLDKGIQAIVRKHFPDLNKDEIGAMLERLSDEGCGYVALCNTIYAEYDGREDEFEKDFGFPMYKDGYLDFNALIVDLYCAEDDESVKGLSLKSAEKIWEHYLSLHGIDVDVVNNLKITPETYYDYVGDGTIILLIRPVILENKDGQIVDDRNEGHFVTITGTTSDGRFIVSSWGRIFYVNPNDNYEYMGFQQVRY